MVINAYTEVAAKINDYFQRARQVYRQDRGDFYVTSKTLAGLHLAVLPERDTYAFSSYNAGDPQDVDKLKRLFHQEKIYRTYNCGLCPIQEKDNAVLVSDEQNQLTYSERLPHVQISTLFKGETKRYILSGTVPQYYYNQLLLVAENHLPTYNVFMDRTTFRDTLLFIERCTVVNPKIKAVFNGNFGSDIFHYHIHLTDQTIYYIDEMDWTYEGIGSRIHQHGVVAFKAYSDSDLDRLFINLATELSPFIAGNKFNNSYIITSSLFFRAGLYRVIINVTRKLDNNKLPTFEGCGLYLFPGAYMISIGCFDKIKSHAELETFLTRAFAEAYTPIMNSLQKDYIFSPDDPLYRQFQTGIETFLAQPLSNDVLENSVVEMLDLLFRDKWLRDKPLDALSIYRYIEENWSCGSTSSVCDVNRTSKYNYLLGFIVSSLDGQVDLTDLKVRSTYQYLSNYKSASDTVNLEYLYFKGRFLQELLQKTFSDFLLTSADPTQYTQGISVNTHRIRKWLNYNFKRIGSESAFGKITASSLLTNDELVVKILDTALTREFIHEFFATMAVNGIRKLIPNFVFTFGGFMCNTSDYKKDICDGRSDGGGKMYNYLLMEFIKGRDVGASMDLPRLASPTEVQDELDMLYQLFVGLHIAYQADEFTHYDLHVGNVMQFDFIANKNYLKLLSTYYEDESSIPNINKVVFRYVDKNGKVFIMPARYLYIVIDYGNSWLKSAPNKYIPEHYKTKYGMLGDTRGNPAADCFTFTMSYFAYTLFKRPYLLANKGRWLPNGLTLFFYNFLKLYEPLWLKTPDEIMSALIQLNLSYQFGPYLLSVMRPEYRGTDIKYLSGGYPVDLQMQEKILELFRAHYEQFPLNLNDPDVYIFNWGFVQTPGIEPTSEIKEMISTKVSRVAAVASSLKQFMKTQR